MIRRVRLTVPARRAATHDEASVRRATGSSDWLCRFTHHGAPPLPPVARTLNVVLTA
jgi:hypothetical protein